MCVQNLVPIVPQATMCIPSEGYTHTHTHTDRHTHTLSYIDIDGKKSLNSEDINNKSSVFLISSRQLISYKDRYF